MVDKELIMRFRSLLPASRGVRELRNSEAEVVTERVKSHFVEEPDAIWWWEALSSNSVSIRYGSADGLKLLGCLIPSQELVRLAVTDDEPGHWPVFEGEAGALCSLVREIPFFEFFVTSMECDWVVFDTHHNCLVVTGALLQRARCLMGVAFKGGTEL